MSQLPLAPLSMRTRHGGSFVLSRLQVVLAEASPTLRASARSARGPATRSAPYFASDAGIVASAPHRHLLRDDVVGLDVRGRGRRGTPSPRRPSSTAAARFFSGQPEPPSSKNIGLYLRPADAAGVVDVARERVDRLLRRRRRSRRRAAACEHAGVAAAAWLYGEADLDLLVGDALRAEAEVAGSDAGSERRSECSSAPRRPGRPVLRGVVVRRRRADGIGVASVSPASTNGSSRVSRDRPRRRSVGSFAPIDAIAVMRTTRRRCPTVCSPSSTERNGRSAAASDGLTALLRSSCVTAGPMRQPTSPRAGASAVRRSRLRKSSAMCSMSCRVTPRDPAADTIDPVARERMSAIGLRESGRDCLRSSRSRQRIGERPAAGDRLEASAAFAPARLVAEARCP